MNGRTSLGSDYLDADWIRGEKSISTKYADRLTRDPRVEIRAAYANHASISSWALSDFRNDPSPIVLGCAANHPRAPYSVLEKALASEHWAPRQSACGNKILPDELLLPHFRSFGWVEYIVLVNKKNVPREVLEHIATIKEDWRGEGQEKRDWNGDLRNRARKRLNWSKEEEPDSPGK
jgi:hypothetical protein